MAGRVLQVNVKPETPGERGMPKRPVPEARILRAGVEGDFNRFRHEKQADHPDSALLLMPIETIREINAAGWPVAAGDIGENLTTEGIPYADFRVGDRWRVGEALIEISKPCTPCKFLGGLPYVGAERQVDFAKAMIGRRGWHARVIEEGRVRPGDAIERASP